MGAAHNLKSPQDWFAAARIKATQLLPYFASAVMGLVPYALPGFGTLAVTKRGVLIWDPELSKRWTVENLAWVLLHEAGHYLRDHAGRQVQCSAEHTLFNIAGDAEINDDLVAAGAVFPVLSREDGEDIPEEKLGQPSGVLPLDIGCEDGRLAEEYYAHLRKHSKGGKQGTLQLLPSAGAKDSGKGSGRAQKGSGRGKGTAQGPGDSQGSGTAPGGSQTVLVQLGSSCGSGAGQEPSQAELEVPGHLGKSPAEQKRIQREVAEAVRKQAEKGRGTVSAGLARWAEAVLGPPHIPWQQKLARACRSAVAFRPGAGDYRYDRPSRRQGAFGYGTGSPVFPALRMPIPRCAVIVDTSGSMGSDELKQGLEEIKGILAAVGADVDFFACDAAVHSAVKVRNVKDAARALKGGGGTDMRPAFEAVARLPRKPEVIVVCSDGQIGDPGPKPPKTHVVWLVCGPHHNLELPWGEVVQMPQKTEA